MKEKKMRQKKVKKEKKPMSKKKILLVGFVVLFFLILAGVIALIAMKGNKPGPSGNQMTFFDFDDMQSNRDNDSSYQETGTIVTATGVTSMGVISEDFEVTDLTTGLYIEEVYVSSGTAVEEGTALFKLSGDSVEEARGELTSILTETDLAYRAGVIEYEQNLINIKYEYDLSVLEGKQAKAVYEESISRLSDGVEKAQDALDEANALIAEYEDAIANDTYASVYPYEELKALYDENLKILMDKMEEWGVGWEKVTGGRASNQYETVLQGLYSVLEQNAKDYEDAKNSYDQAMEDAQVQLKKQKLKLSSLQVSLANAQKEKEEGLLSAKLTYEKALAEAEQAEKNYEASMEQAEAEYEELLDAKEDAKENLELFEETVGDGYFYASKAGSILRVSSRAGSYLRSDSTVASYSNKEDVTVTLSVAQESIANIAVGDSAMVSDSEGNMWQAVVKEINPISSSESRTSVSYSVVIRFTGDTSNVSANTEVTVIFGMGGMMNEKVN